MRLDAVTARRSWCDAPRSPLLCDDGLDRKAVYRLGSAPAGRLSASGCQRFRTQGLDGPATTIRKTFESRSVSSKTTNRHRATPADPLSRTKRPEGHSRPQPRCRSMEDTAGFIEDCAVQRAVWSAFSIQPHPQKHFELLATDRYYEGDGPRHPVKEMYLNPPEACRWLALRRRKDPDALGS